MPRYSLLLLIIIPIANGYIFDPSRTRKVLIVPKNKNGWHDSATFAPIDPIQIGTQDWEDLTEVERYYLETKGTLRFSGSSAYDYGNQELKDDYDVSDYIDEEDKEDDDEKGSGDYGDVSKEDEDSEYEGYLEDEFDDYDNQYECDNY
ncbi:hypothetical protein L5515_010351 [Caenorhabditis briggsae]|uniref:Uncharacterized protein n=1 Tax=Caenorhabditis briggsae TaxID=6238 RepID=A0AAE9ELV3_CAEBR|nr:hypothetical protein L5515_010351 [Caenorhabditis briggsae]